MRDGVPERARIGPEESLAPQAGRGRPCWLGFRRGLRLASLRRSPRRLLVASRAREPHEIRQPLVSQGHLAVVPGQDRGQHLHGLMRLAALLQCDRVRGDEAFPVLPVGDPQDRESQARAEMLIGRRTLVPAPGDKRGYAVDQQRWPALAQKRVGEPGSIALIRAQLGQRVVPLAKPVPQHRRGDPGAAVGTAAALGRTPWARWRASSASGQRSRFCKGEDTVIEGERAQVRVAGIVAEHAQRLVDVAERGDLVAPDAMAQPQVGQGVGGRERVAGLPRRR